ncbi:hypothetical protein OOU_Y34scaffold00707g8 [Pyricularia oryzae Y34]|uniref:Uncharacterized protein n=1 Tax=Pyricularia oryzae (strain Y34) TaxID=1143189 RepID=A0AA97NS86_PYRO3|nr:hypothetical protein OOU_Y34scaffold00707g8 [Pyricularia oryzae Y34]
MSTVHCKMLENQAKTIPCAGKVFPGA